ncbi:MAG: hypothetical protein WC887_01890 [Candidatus Paceibacterota bacterium]|jgi:hypothetical protein
MSWCFALVNGHTVEIYFEAGRNRQSKILGHAYVCPEEFATKKEKLWLRKDTKRFRLSYRKGVYKHLPSTVHIDIGSHDEVY